MFFVTPQAELDASRLALDAMRNAGSFGEMRRAWQDFIIRLEKAWNKMQLQYKRSSGPLRKHLDRAVSLRKSEALLQYLKQVRHADEHSLQSSAYILQGFKITLPPGALIDIDFAKGTASASGRDVTVGIGSPQYYLAPITNYGTSFEPPTTYLGQVLADCSPIHVAELGLAFYEQLCNDLQQNI